jgi:hypothetical protein
VETFVIRVGTPAEQTADSDLHDIHGLVEHVRTGRRTAFRESRELIAFLQIAADAIDQAGNQPKAKR